MLLCTHTRADPLIVVQLVSQSGRHRGAVYYPSVAVRVRPMRLALGEALMWRMVTAARLLGAAAAPTAASGAAGAQAGPQVPAGGNVQGTPAQVRKGLRGKGEAGGGAFVASLRSSRDSSNRGVKGERGRGR